MKKAYFISNEKWNIDEVDYTERTYVQIIKEGIKRAKDNKQEFAAIVIEDTDYSDPFFAIAPVRNANALAIFDPTELSEYHSKWNSADSPPITTIIEFSTIHHGVSNSYYRLLWKEWDNFMYQWRLAKDGKLYIGQIYSRFKLFINAVRRVCGAIQTGQL